MKSVVGVLALQGGFTRHGAVIESLGDVSREIRFAEDLAPCDALIIPGGESTVLTRLLMQSDSGPAEGKPWKPGALYEAIRVFAAEKPVMGTCAGLILLARPCGDDRVAPFGLLPVSVERNAYGRQTESFVAPISLRLPSGSPVKGNTGSLSWGSGAPFPATFIRAPRITKIDPAVTVLACANGNPGEGGEAVIVQYGRILGLTFHPELTPNDARIHEYFLRLCR